MSTELVAKEYTFEELVEIVDAGLKTALLTRKAATILSNMEYPHGGYNSFEELVQSRWGWGERWIDQQLRNQKALDELPNELQIQFESGAALRELAKVPKELRLTVAEKATDGGTKPATFTSVKKATPPVPKPPKAKKSPPPPPKPAKGKKVAPKLPTDRYGCEIPKEVQEVWDRGVEAETLLTYLDSVDKAIKKAGEISDANYVTFNFSGSKSALNQLILNLRELIPHAICATCGGKTPKDCQACKGRGFVSEFFWRNCVPKDIREMREKK